MVLKNKSNSKIISKNLKELTTLTEKSRGVLDKNNGSEVLFKTRFGIHTFFLKNPIDILILDQKMRVVKISENLKPFRMMFWNPIYDTVVELPPKTIQLSSTKVGDVLHLGL